MRDRQTGSVWTHYDGAVLQGPLAEQDIQLRMLPMVQTTWDQWIAAYPESVVLDWYAKYAEQYRWMDGSGPGPLGPEFVRTVLNWDDRLPERELVLGVALADERRAYVLSEFPSELAVLEDELAGVPLAIFLDPSADFGLAFTARLDDQILEFEVVDGLITDATGSVWDLRGRALSGPLAGQQLEFVTSFMTQWYGWAAYHPGTTIYGRD